ncbi:PrsW family glutamic-type intramembrane protease [Spirochaeta dissipatitropha]
MINAVYFSFILPLLFLILVTKGESRSLILLFAWGLTAALTVYTMTDLLARYSTISLEIQLVYIIPGMEEFIKILPLFILFPKVNRSLRYSLPRYAMASGIGFSILENYVYLSLLYADGSNPVLFILLRSLTACLMHGSASALIGLGLQYLLNYGYMSIQLIIGFFLSAVALHALYNLLGMHPVWAPIGFLLPLAAFGFLLYPLNAFGIHVSRRVPAKNGGADNA